LTKRQVDEMIERREIGDFFGKVHFHFRRSLGPPL
jgi:hypothetical protein